MIKLFKKYKYFTVIYAVLIVLIGIFSFSLLNVNVTKEFSKGVIAVNTDRQVYVPGETVHIQMGVLDPKGHTICNADLELSINGVKVDGINNSSTCGDDNVTNSPDYYYDYKIDQTGNYNIKLSDKSTGLVTENQFKVVSNRDIDVIRETATRINPFKSDRYPVKLIVTSVKDYHGEISDSFPQGFIIPWQGPAKINGNRISWQVDLKAGESKELVYEYRAPKESPEFYKIGNNAEWQVLSDAAKTASVTGNWNDTNTWGGAAVPVAGDTCSINTGITVTVDITNATCGSLTINTSGSGSGNATLTFAASGSPALVITTSGGQSGATVIGSASRANQTGTITFVSGASMTTTTLQLGATGTQSSVLTMTGGSTLTVGGAITVGGSGSTWTPSTGTVVLTANNTLPATKFTTFYNLQITGGTTTLGVNLATIAGGTLTQNGGNIAVGTFTLTVNGSHDAGSTNTVSGAGGYTLASGATLITANSSGINGSITTTTKTLNVAANYTFNGSGAQNVGTLLPTNLTGILTVNSGNTVTLDSAKTIASTGSVTIQAGTFAAGTNLTMATTSTINRSGGTMTGTPQGTGVYNVSYTGNSMTTTTELAGSGLGTVTVNLTSGQTLTLDTNRAPDANLTITSGILDLSTFTIDRSASGGTLTISNGASLKIGGTNIMPANYTTHTFGATSTVEYYGTNQTVSADTYGNLTFSGSGTKTIAGTTVINGTFTNGSGVTIATGNNALTFGGDFVNSGVALNAGSSTITLNGTATQSIAGFTTTGTVSMTKTGGTATFQGNVSGGALTINGSGGVLSLGTGLTHTFSGDVTLTAGTLNGGSSTLNENNTSVTAWGGTGSNFSAGTGTVSFGGGNQTLSASATTFNALTFAGTGTKTLSSATVINGNFSNGSGVTIATGNNALTFGGNFTNSGVALNAGSSPITITGTATQSIAGFTTTGLLSMTKTGGVATLSGNVSGGALTINGTGGTLNLGSGLTHTFTGTWTRTAGTLDGGSSTLNLQGAFSGTGGAFTASTSTVNYNGSGSQTIPALTFYILKINNAAGATLTGATTVTSLAIGDLTASSVFNDGGFQIIGNAAGTMTMSATAALNLGTAGAATLFPTNFTNPNITLNAASTVTYNSGLAQTVSGVPTYGNLIIDGGSTKSLGAATVVAGTLTVTAGDTLDTTSGGHYALNSAIINIAATGTLNIETSTLTITGTSGTLFTNSGVFTAGTNSTTIFNGATAPTALLSGSFTGSNAFYNLTLSPTIGGAVGYTMGAAFTTNGNFTMDTTSSGSNTLTATLSGTTIVTGLTDLKGEISGLSALSTGADQAFTTGTINIEGGGTFTANNSTVTINGTTGPLFTRNGTFNAGGSTVNFSETTSDLVLTNGTVAFNTLQMSMSGKTGTLGAAISVGANLTISAGTLADGGYQITGNASGTLSAASGAGLTLGTAGSATVFPITFTSGHISLNAASTVTYASALSQTISGTPTYGNLTLTGASTKTLDAATTAAGTLTISAGTLSTSGSNYNMNIAGNWVNNGTFSPGTDTVTFNGTTTQTISGTTATTFNSLTDSNTSAALTTSGNLSIGGTLTVNLSANFSPSAGTVTFTGSTIVNSGTLALVNINITGTTTTASSFSVSGNWSSSSSFTASAGTITLNGADGSTQAITGNSTFKNLTATTASNSTGRTLQFAGLSTTTVSGTWTITGDTSKIITLQSSDSNNWSISPTSASVSFASISKSTNTIPYICATNSTNGGGNSGWVISGGPSCGYIPGTINTNAKGINLKGLILN